MGGKQRAVRLLIPEEMDCFRCNTFDPLLSYALYLPSPPTTCRPTPIDSRDQSAITATDELLTFPSALVTTAAINPAPRQQTPSSVDNHFSEDDDEEELRAIRQAALAWMLQDNANSHSVDTVPSALPVSADLNQPSTKVRQAPPPTLAPMNVIVDPITQWHAVCSDVSINEPPATGSDGAPIAANVSPELVQFHRLCRRCARCHVPTNLPAATQLRLHTLLGPRVCFDELAGCGRRSEEVADSERAPLSTAAMHDPASGPHDDSTQVDEVRDRMSPVFDCAAAADPVVDDLEAPVLICETDVSTVGMLEDNQMDESIPTLSPCAPDQNGTLAVLPPVATATLLARIDARSVGMEKEISPRNNVVDLDDDQYSPHLRHHGIAFPVAKRLSFSESSTTSTPEKAESVRPVSSNNGPGSVFMEQPPVMKRGRSRAAISHHRTSTSLCDVYPEEQDDQSVRRRIRCSRRTFVPCSSPSSQPSCSAPRSSRTAARVARESISLVTRALNSPTRIDRYLDRTAHIATINLEHMNDGDESTAVHVPMEVRRLRSWVFDDAAVDECPPHSTRSQRARKRPHSTSSPTREPCRMRNHRSTSSAPRRRVYTFDEESD